MKHTTYTISDAAKVLNVEAHVLRYWEEELELEIHRNNLGHRSYSDKDIQTFKNIKALKDEGFSLHDIKASLPKLIKCKKMDKQTIEELRRELSALTVSTTSAVTSSAEAGIPDKLGQFKDIMNSIISQAISDNNARLASMIIDDTSERVIKEMNYLFRTLDEDEDVRIKQLEAAISAASLAKLEAAASGNSPSAKGGLFRKRKKKLP